MRKKIILVSFLLFVIYYAVTDECDSFALLLGLISLGGVYADGSSKMVMHIF